MGLGVIHFVVFSAWLSGMIGPDFIVFAGTIIFLLSSLITAAYVATCTVEAAVKFEDAFAFNYRGYSTIAEYLGL